MRLSVSGGTPARSTSNPGLTTLLRPRADRQARRRRTCGLNRAGALARNRISVGTFKGAVRSGQERQRLGGARVVLVDDRLTTGTTLGACPWSFGPQQGGAAGAYADESLALTAAMTPAATSSFEP